jgi:hypothetical protein
MGSDFYSSSHRPDDSSETTWPSADVSELAQARETTIAYSCELKRRADHFTFEHDQHKRPFTLTSPDGQTEHFGDNPAKCLIAEPDPETGAMQPVVKHGRPAIVYLCREQRER